MTSAEDNQDELTSADEVAEPPSGPLRRSPGGMLMAQRETLELSVQQVADQLHLTMHFVRAIESDSYEKLPGDVFVRGYIRTYARLLRLDPDQVLMIYDEFNSHKLARKEEAIKRRERRRKDKNRPWILVSGVAFVSVAVALWYLNSDQPMDNVADPVSEPAALAIEEVPGSATLSATNERVAEERVAEERAVVTPVAPEPDGVQGLSAQSSADASELIANDGTVTVDTSPADTSSGNVSTDIVPAVDAQDNAGAEALVPDVTGQTEAASASPASGRTVMENWSGADELRIGFRTDSAVQIEHKGGTEAHEYDHVAGETLVIRGTAPFSVLLGDARNVSLSFNGRQIDISSNIRVDNSARLSIGM